MQKKASPRPSLKGGEVGGESGWEGGDIGEERGGIPPRTEHRCATNQQDDNRNRSWK